MPFSLQDPVFKQVTWALGNANN